MIVKAPASLRGWGREAGALTAAANYGTRQVWASNS
jgi:hypothetical protein